MAKSAKKDGTLFTNSPGDSVSYELRLVYSIIHLDEPTSGEIAKAMGIGRTAVINKIQTLCKPYPDGFGMDITASRKGYSIQDYGVLNEQDLKK